MYQRGFSPLILIAAAGLMIAATGGSFWQYEKAKQSKPAASKTEVAKQKSPATPATQTKPQAKKRDDLGCWPPSCSVIPDPKGQQTCTDWKVGKTVKWPVCSYFSGQGSCQKLCETETKTGAESAGSGAASAPPAAPCNLGPLQRQFSDTPYYTGPLFDGHFHMPQMFKIPNNPDAPVIDVDVSRRDTACLFSDKSRIKNVFAFYGIPVNLKDQSIAIARDIEKQYPGTMSPFLELVSFPGYPVIPTNITEVLALNKGLFKGYGELSLYLPHYNGVMPNDPAMKELYGIAQKNNLIVMMHLTASQQKAFEEVLHDYPNVKFLVHAAEHLPWANTFFDTYFDTYPNLYYSEDIDLVESAMIPATTKADFIARMKQNWQTMLSTKTSQWKSRIEKYPDRFLWGTDRGHYTWHYDREVQAYLEEFGRAFIGQLDGAVQEKYAYKNAEALLQKK